MNQENKKHIEENTLLSTDVSSVFVVQNSRKRPFIEQFEHTSVNFTQKELGTMLGFFIVRDESATSENIVNFLSSEVKKQYFSPIEKPVEEKFESALHRINRALEEIANIGNVSWIGTVEGAVCIIDDTSIHFSVAGEACILLLRNDMLIDISEGLASEDAVNYPLKTFVDISSGDIAAHDKIIITSRELLELVSLEELQKNAIRMGEKNFVQFIETALKNECTIASTTIIDITEENVLHISSPAEKPSQEDGKEEVPKNFFAASTFEKTEKLPEDTLQDRNVTNADGNNTVDIDELAEDIPKEYTDPRTGHIHIQGDEDLPENPTFLENLSEKTSDITDNLKDFSQKKTRLFSKKIASLRKEKNDTAEDFDDAQTKEFTRESTDQYGNKNFAKNAKAYFYRICATSKDTAKKTSAYCAKIITKTREKNVASRNKKDTDSQYSYTYSQEFSPEQRKKKTILPHISKIKKLWSAMDNKTKLITLSIIAFIIFVPLVFSLFSRNEQEVDIKELSGEQEAELDLNEVQKPVKQENESAISDPMTLYKTDKALQIFVLKEIPIGIEEKTIHIFDEKREEFPVPDDAGNITHATPMDDLNMIFFITDKDKLYSFSPVAKKYTEQTNIPEIDHTKIQLLSTFMTYLYILDQDMITRHTRIEGGFDEGKEWLDEDFDFSDATSFSINDEIFTTQKNDITKFSEGKKDRYSKDSDIQNASLAYTTEDMKYVWIIDKKSNTLYKTKKDNGSIIDSYMHTVFSETISFSIDEKQDLTFITTKNEISQISLEK